MPYPLIDRLTDDLGYPRVDVKTLDTVLNAADNTVLFFTGDPASTPEALDVAVVLPEIVRHFGERLAPAVVSRDDERTLQAMYGFEQWPTLVFLHRDRYLGAISRIQDWTDYIARIQGFLDNGPVRPPAPRIPILPA